jgi:hypothetical protein
MLQNSINLESAPHGVPVTNAAGTALQAQTLDNGEIIIGSTGGMPMAASIQAGSNVTIVQGPNSITINASGGTGPGFDAIDIKTITTSGTYTPPANLAFIVLEAVGGGGAGGGASVGGTNRHSIGALGGIATGGAINIGGPRGATSGVRNTTPFVPLYGSPTYTITGFGQGANANLRGPMEIAEAGGSGQSGQVTITEYLGV